MRKKARIWKSIALVMAAAMALTACSGGSTDTSGTSEASGTEAAGTEGGTYKDTLHIAVTQQSPSLDLHKNSTLIARQMCDGTVWEKLVTLNAQSEASPELCESYEVSEDGKTITFVLRQGVKFHDGSIMTADDVVASMNRWIESFSSVNTMVGDARFEKVDDNTVQISADTSLILLPSIIAGSGQPASITTAEACENEDDNGFLVDYIGTGPYKFVRWDKNESVVMERFDDYWGEAPVAKTLVFRTITDNSARVVALTNGEVDIIDGIDANVVDQITSAGCKLYQTEGMNINYLAYNMDRMTDPEVRKALSEAINVPELVASLYQGYATEAHTILPGFMPGYSEDVQQTAYNPEEAQQILADKGISSLKLMTYTNPRPYNTATGQTLAEALQGYWAQVGVDVTIDSYDWTTYKERIPSGDYDMCLYGWIGDNGDPDNFMYLLAHDDPTMNVANYHNEEFNEMLSAAAALPNGDERNAAYGEMETMIAGENVWLPISHQQNLSAYVSNVQNYISHPTGNVYLSKTYKN